MKYLRSRVNGMVFEYTDRLAANPNVEVLTEQQAFPERFAPAAALKRVPTIKLDVPEEAVAKPEVSPELAAQRGVTFTGIGSPKQTKTKKLSSADIVGLGEF